MGEYRNSGVDNANNANFAARVFEQQSNFIRAVIRHNVKNRAIEDDIFQDVFLTLVRKPPPQGDNNIKGYLYKLITSSIIDAARRTKRYHDHLQKYCQTLNYSLNNHNAENDLISEEETARFFEGIGKLLTDSEAEAVLLRYRHDCKPCEIAAKMQVKPRTVHRYICVALRKLREFLTAQGGKSL